MIKIINPKNNSVQWGDAHFTGTEIKILGKSALKGQFIETESEVLIESRSENEIQVISLPASDKGVRISGTIHRRRLTLGDGGWEDRGVDKYPAAEVRKAGSLEAYAYTLSPRHIAQLEERVSDSQLHRREPNPNSPQRREPRKD